MKTECASDKRKKEFTQKNHLNIHREYNHGNTNKNPFDATN